MPLNLVKIANGLVVSDALPLQVRGKTRDGATGESIEQANSVGGTTSRIWGRVAMLIIDEGSGRLWFSPKPQRGVVEGFRESSFCCLGNIRCLSSNLGRLVASDRGFDISTSNVKEKQCISMFTMNVTLTSN